MSEIAGIAAAIFKRLGGRERIIVAIAGAPASGKSTLAAKLARVLPEGTAAVVPMDGFHFDDAVLIARGQRQRKGAPETFDFAGFKVLLSRLREREPDVAIPVFDRTIELSRAGGAIVSADTRIILVEGNYLLLDEAPWSQLEPLFDFSIFVDVSREDLERRLLQRWDEHGKTPEEARAWIASNDMPNIERVLSRRRVADLVVR
jgi:pantothenate kinase